MIGLAAPGTAREGDFQALNAKPAGNIEHTDR
jgi:hypothetical protein